MNVSLLVQYLLPWLSNSRVSFMYPDLSLYSFLDAVVFLIGLLLEDTAIVSLLFSFQFSSLTAVNDPFA
jgi:hypothetical protein